MIVLGGGMSNVERLYANVPQLWGALDILRPRATPARAQRARRLERRARRGAPVAGVSERRARASYIDV